MIERAPQAQRDGPPLDPRANDVPHTDGRVVPPLHCTNPPSDSASNNANHKSGAATAASGTYVFQVRAWEANVAVHDTSATGSYSVAWPTGTAPGPPRSMAAAVSGNTAALSWQPPSSGGAPSTYLLSVGTRSGASDVANGYNVGNVLSVSTETRTSTGG